MTEVVGLWESVSDDESEDKVNIGEVQSTPTPGESPLAQSFCLLYTSRCV